MASDKYHTDGRRKSQGRRPKHSNYKQRQSRPLPRVSYENLLLRFTACINCGYFITSYRAHHGNDVLKQALSQSNERRDGWLQLPWDIATRQLIHRFFGIRSDVGPMHMEFMCTTCQRKFLYSEEEVEVPVVVSEAQSDEPLEATVENEGSVAEVADEVEADAETETDAEAETETEGVDEPVETIIETRILFQVELKIR